jgi:probable HAF family extracellular repeat protein
MESAMYCHPLGVIAAICCTAGLAFGSAAANAQNLLTDLGVATGYAINDSGQVALSSGIYSNGTVTPLPALPNQISAGPPLAINANGDAAGSATTTSGGPFATAYPAGGGAINLFAAFSGRELLQSGTATGINSGGTAVGWIDTFNFSGPGAPIVGFTYSGGTLTTLSVPCSPTSSSNCSGIAWNYVYGINDSNQLVGSVNYMPSAFGATNDAYLYSGGTWTDLGPGASYAINETGQITGSLMIFAPGGPPYQQTGSYAFLHSGGATLNLGTLPGGKNSIGYALNATGQVVGSSDFTGTTATHAFFYNGVMSDLNALVSATDPLQPYVTLTSAVGINDNLLILANGVDSRTNLAHAYLLQAPFMQIAPAALSFGTEAVGGTSPSQSVVIANNGVSAIALGTISAGTNFSIQSNGCGTSLASGSQCTITVALAPTMAGALTSALTIPAEAVSYQVQLSGVAPITATISASSSTAAVGTPITITWATAPGSACTELSSSPTSPWNGSIGQSGSITLTDTVAETVFYSVNCTATGTPTVGSQVTVVWTWPPVTATLTASPTTITAGQSTTLTWTSANATSCAATGGGSADGWSGSNLPTSGNKMVTESYALAVPSVTLTFGITCTSSASGLSRQATANIVYNQPPAAKSGGGGAIDWLSLIALFGIFVMRQQRRPSRAAIH